VDALGSPIGFFLTGVEAHDLVGTDHLLPTMEADTLIGDKPAPAKAGWRSTPMCAYLSRWQDGQDYGDPPANQPILAARL